MTGWWFRTFFDVLGIIIPIDFHTFSEGSKSPTRQIHRVSVFLFFIRALGDVTHHQKRKFPIVQGWVKLGPSCFFQDQSSYSYNVGPKKMMVVCFLTPESIVTSTIKHSFWDTVTVLQIIIHWMLSLTH